MSAAEIIEPSGEPLVFSQRASLKRFLGLSLKNGLLNLVTLTLYRFWGKTEVRRRVWGSTYLNDEPFEYTGRGVELFVGFLIALGVIGVPFLLFGFGAQFLGPVAAALIILPLYVFLGWLVGFGQFTAFRYMASRTAWRGVHFRLTGSAAAYGWKVLGYSVLSGLTIGWFWPAAQRRLAAPLWGGLRFGDRNLSFDLDQARRVGVYGPYALGWVVMIVGYLVLVAIFAGPAGSLERTEPSLRQIGLIYLVLGIMGLGYCVAFAPYHAAALRSVTAGIAFGDVRFRLALRWTDLAWLWVSNLLLIVFTLGFLMPFVQARTARFLIQRLAADGLADLDGIHQAAGQAPRTGEGLADAFGLAPI